MIGHDGDRLSPGRAISTLTGLRTCELDIASLLAELPAMDRERRLGLAAHMLDDSLWLLP